MDYKRVLLKISGEAFMGNQEYGIDHEATLEVAKKIQELRNHAIEVGIVIGGGNIFRGVQQGPSLQLERTRADQIGMLGTMMNGLVLEQALEKLGCPVRLLSALECPKVCKSYQWERAMKSFKKGQIVLFVGGTGHPYFTTDTCAALRACEIHADILLKATTRVDGVYDADPRQDPKAKKYQKLTFQEVLEKRLGVMDLSAMTLCMTSHIPVKVFNFYEGSLLDALSDKPLGTLVEE